MRPDELRHLPFAVVLTFPVPMAPSGLNDLMDQTVDDAAFPLFCLFFGMFYARLCVDM